MLNPAGSVPQSAGTLFFAAAILHTFLIKKLRQFSHRFDKGSLAQRGFHIASEIELVFVLWAALFFVFFVSTRGFQEAAEYFSGLEFREPLFVFCLMLFASLRPVLIFSGNLFRFASHLFSRIFRFPEKQADLLTILTLGPLAGSFITEPAAITVSALLLSQMLQRPRRSFLYALLAVLFVNISVGGALTPYAAPPILMVARQFGWDFHYMLTHFAASVILAVGLNALILVLIFASEIKNQVMSLREVQSNILAHQRHFKLFRLRESFFVALFLAGLVVFGPLQRWWLEPLLLQLTDAALYLGSVGLTAIVDNAALTYLGSQVAGLAPASQYLLVAGAIAGGGLTLIANAPNPAGYSILQKHFGDQFSAFYLLLAALPPTLIVVFLLFQG